MENNFFDELLAEHGIGSLDEDIKAEPAHAPDPEADAERQRRLEELIARENIQPANEKEPEPFVVAYKRNRDGQFVSLPRPRWPSPGAEKTPEICAAYQREENLVWDADNKLASCVRWFGIKMYNADQWENNGYEYNRPPLYEQFAHYWDYLTGLWRSRNIEVPSETDLKKWSKEGAVRLT